MVSDLSMNLSEANIWITGLGFPPNFGSKDPTSYREMGESSQGAVNISNTGNKSQQKSRNENTLVQRIKKQNKKQNGSK